MRRFFTAHRFTARRFTAQRLVRCAALLSFILLSVAGAQKDEAIALAAAHPALEPLLALHGGWTADAYDTENRYDVWRVQFYFPGGEKLGWADVSLTTKKVYAWEASYELTGDLQKKTERALYRFVRRSPEVRSLVGDTAPVAKWFWYDSWREGWFVHLERGPDSLDVSIRSRSQGSLKLDDLFIEKIYFPQVLPLEDYRAAQGSSAVALAFSSPEIAAALRNRPGWKGSGTRLNAQTWGVLFLQAEHKIARAVVNLKTQRVHKVTVYP